jgi:cell division protein FtsW
MSAET